jgi:hypothetical protein
MIAAPDQVEAVMWLRLASCLCLCSLDARTNALTGLTWLNPTQKASLPIQVKTDGRTPIYLRGAFLDLRLNFAGGRPMSFGPPILLSPRQALAVYA